MPLFRRHRGSLDESLLTTIIVKDRKELLKIINDESAYMFYMHPNDSVELTIEPYPDQSKCFDRRIGWFTQMVSITFKNIKAQPIGFLSEPID